MSEDGDMWREIKKSRQEEKARNRQNAFNILCESGLFFTSHNEGTHLVVMEGGKTIDFFPGTGMFRVRGSKKVYGDVHDLLRYLKEENA